MEIEPDGAPVSYLELLGLLGSYLKLRGAPGISWELLRASGSSVSAKFYPEHRVRQSSALPAVLRVPGRAAQTGLAVWPPGW